MAKPLAGIRVLDMGTFITGPAAGVLLADLGAEVIKVEQPGAGDPFRSFKGGLYSPHYQTYNRGKKSVTLNTKQPEDLAAMDELVKGADVFIQNFRPGVAERLKVDAPRLRALNPRLIYCGISGFGNDGPAKDRPAFDTVAQASAGFLRLLVNPEHPRVVGPAIADALTSSGDAFTLRQLHVRQIPKSARTADELLEMAEDEELSFARPGLQRHALRKLRRGYWHIRDELDLHGLTRDVARRMLTVFLDNSVLRGYRCVRVIHGRGLSSKDRRPVLKILLGHWLVQRNDVLAFCQARPEHGGSGAVLILLRNPDK